VAQFKLDHRFDAERCRHYLNNIVTVLHCHHYATLFTQLAIDAKELVDGTRILKETAEDIFFKMLSDYFKQNAVADPKERLDLAVQLYSICGLGKMAVTAANENGGTVQMPYAHVDEGWLKKWGKFGTSVNFIGAGFIAATFAATYSKPTRSFSVEEQQSRVSGASQSIFKISK